jgi:hypothetical protein
MGNRRLIKGLTNDGKPAEARVPAPVTDFDRTSLEISWLETETQTMGCRRVDIGQAVSVHKWGV